jgi:hypothetical protein
MLIVRLTKIFVDRGRIFLYYNQKWIIKKTMSGRVIIVWDICSELGLV